MRSLAVGNGAGEPEALCWEDCLRLVETATTGRVALTVHALPTIVPLEFVVTAGGIVISTVRDSWIDAAIDEAIVAFETDGVDLPHACRWHVVVVGVAAELPEAESRHNDRLAARLGVLDSKRDRLVRISLSFVSGHRTPLPRRTFTHSG